MNSEFICSDPGDEMNNIKRFVNTEASATNLLSEAQWLELYRLCGYREDELRIKRNRLQRFLKASKSTTKIELQRRINALEKLLKEVADRTWSRMV